MTFSDLIQFVGNSSSALGRLNPELIHPILEAIRAKATPTSEDKIFISIFNTELVPKFNSLTSFLSECNRYSSRNISIDRAYKEIDSTFQSKVDEFRLGLNEHITRTKNLVNDYNNKTGIFA